jgi:hypothetical protein
MLPPDMERRAWGFPPRLSHADVAARHLHDVQTIHPSPSARQFRLLFNRVAPSEAETKVLQR